jgi:hypothetical protein
MEEEVRMKKEEGRRHRETLKLHFFLLPSSF